MAQITHGLRGLLGFPLVYWGLQKFLGSDKAIKIYVDEYIRPSGNDVILDIGCGTAEILRYLPPTVKYYGFDLNKKYVEFAQKKFGHQAIICNDVNNDIMSKLPKFDIILANAILHHLDDHEVKKLFTMSLAGLKNTGRMLTLDCCYTDHQSKIAKFIISKDRGRNIRTVCEYEAAALQSFATVKTSVRHDLLRVPYTHVIMECTTKNK